MSKLEKFTIEGHNISHVSEMVLILLTNLNNVTHEYYLKL